MVRRALRNFIEKETSAGIALFFFALTAFLLKNSPLAYIYDGMTSNSQINHFINDGLMSIFFFLVGLEIKREFVDGELSNIKTSLLPIIAAAGGMIVPALVYFVINLSDPAAARGWAIPCATDIAFSLGILSLLGSRVKTSLKVFLTALAIIDDLGAILIIAFFYTGNLALSYLGYSVLICAGLLILNKLKIASKLPYLILSLGLWYCIHHSGIHATIAGVLAALFIPYQVKNKSPLKELENRLHPIVGFFIMPVFALFNAGVGILDIQLSTVFSALTIGITLGLFLGKQAGVMIFSWLAVKSGLTRMPSEASWAEFYGTAILTGVGFTMSLFINNLAFSDPALHTPARLGVMLGSVLSGLFGFAVLYLAVKKEKSLE